MTEANYTQILRRPQVQARTGIPRATMYELMAEGKFPKPIQIAGRRVVGWVESEIEDWLREQIAVSRKAI